MSKLIEKLNVLVRSRVPRVDLPERVPSLARRTKAGDRQVAALRADLDRALDREDQLKGEIAALQHEADDWDRQADRAVAQGDDATARHAIRQMQRARQRAALIEADLDQHRRSTAELISKVNALEARVAEVRSAGNAAPDQVAPKVETLTSRLRQGMSDALASGREQADSDRSEGEVDEARVEDELAQRRARLSQ